MAEERRELLRETILRGVLTLFLGLGLALPVLHIFGLLQYSWLCVGVVAAASMLLAFSGISGIFRIIGLIALAVCAGGWLVSGGSQQVLEVVYAMALHLSGVTAALPLLGGEVTVLLALLITFLAYLFTSRLMGPAVVLPVLVLAAALWITGADHKMLLMLPALAAAATVLACCVHEGDVNGSRILPWMTLLAVAACLLAPPSGTTIAPLKDTADQLRQTIYDHFFFNQSRNVFSLANEGYYPQGTGQLGGPAKPTEHPVMLVETNRRTYLRGVVKDAYTGRIWLDTVSSKRYLWTSPLKRNERSAAFDAALPPEALLSDSIMPVQRVTVTMLNDSESTLFVPQRIRSLNVGGDMVAYFNDASEVFITRDLMEGDTYTANAPLMVAGDVGLDTIIDACAAVADQQTYTRMLNAYTLLPSHLQEQVYTMAYTAAGDAQMPYQTALNVQNYLRSRFQYTLDADMQPNNVDFVANFLLNSKKGYCTHFASAMTVMCRILGLPARYVEGYLAEPTADGVAYVTGMEAHAWTEVYFAGFGWLTFDATPPSHDAPRTPPKQNDPSPQAQEPDESPTPSPAPDDEPTPTPEPTPDPTPDPDDQPQTEAMHTQQPTEQPISAAPTPEPSPDEPPDEPPDLSWLWWVLGALLLLALIVLLVLYILSRRPENLAKKAGSDEARWQVWAQAVHDQLHILRLPRQNDESPQAYLCRVADRDDMPDLLALLGEMENYIAYGRYLPRAEEVDDTRHIYQAVYAGLKPIQRVKLLLLRAFVPAKRRAWTRG